MDVPSTLPPADSRAAGRAAVGSDAGIPAAACRMFCRPALDEAPSLATAAYTRGAAAEVADFVSLAERPTPTVPPSSLLQG